MIAFCPLGEINKGDASSCMSQKKVTKKIHYIDTDLQVVVNWFAELITLINKKGVMVFLADD